MGFGGIASAQDPVEPKLPSGRLIVAHERCSHQVHHSQIVGLDGDHRIEQRDDVRILAGGEVAGAEQLSGLHVRRLSFVDFFEMHDRLRDVAGFIVRQRQVQTHGSIVRIDIQSERILADGFLVASLVRQRRSEIGADVRGFRVDLQEPLVAVDSGGIVARLMSFDSLPQISVRARVRPRLGPGCADNAQAHKEEAKHHFPRLHLTPADAKRDGPKAVLRSNQRFGDSGLVACQYGVNRGLEFGEWLGAENLLGCVQWGIRPQRWRR